MVKYQSQNKRNESDVAKTWVENSDIEFKRKEGKILEF